MNDVQLGNFLFVNRKFHESNLFHTLDLFPLVSSGKMEIGTIITGMQSPTSNGLCLMGRGEENVMYS